jgi:hypothetical protein
MKSLLRRCTHLLLAVVGIACSFPALAAYEYTTVDYPGAVSTQLWGINNSGQVVGTAHLGFCGPTF